MGFRRNPINEDGDEEETGPSWAEPRPQSSLCHPQASTIFLLQLPWPALENTCCRLSHRHRPFHKPLPHRLGCNPTRTKSKGKKRWGKENEHEEIGKTNTSQGRQWCSPQDWDLTLQQQRHTFLAVDSFLSQLECRVIPRSAARQRRTQLVLALSFLAPSS